MKIKLFSHTDLDGIGCNIIIKSIMKGSYIDFSNLNYDKVNEAIEEFITNGEYKNYDLIFITDISVNEEVANLIEEKCKYKTKLLDHHQTAIYLNSYEWASVDVERNGEKTCGSAMLYSELEYNNDCLFSWVENIRKYDTWLWKEKYNDLKPKELNDLLYILGREKFINEALECINDNVFVDEFIEKYRKELNDKQESINRYVEAKNKTLLKIDKEGLIIGVVFGDQHHSELCNKLSELNEDCDLIMMIDGKKVSLRTIKDDVDCSLFAKEYGGGGHQKAAGFTIEESKMIDIVKSIIL